MTPANRDTLLALAPGQRATIWEPCDPPVAAGLHWFGGIRETFYFVFRSLDARRDTSREPPFRPGETFTLAYLPVEQYGGEEHFPKPASYTCQSVRPAEANGQLGWKMEVERQ